MASRNTLDMTTGPVFRKLLLFAFPLMITSFLENLYSTADKIMAGQFVGDNAVAAVGACGSPVNLIVNLFAGIGLGVSVTCGSLLGGKQNKALRECMHTAPLSGFLCGLFVSVLGLLCSHPLLVLMDTPEVIFSDSLTYMRIRIGGAPILLASSFCTNILNAHGDTKRITLSSIASGLVNVVSNFVFIAVFHMGVAGLAWATVLSQLLDLAIRLFILFSPRDVYRLRLAEIRLHKKYIKTIFSIGIPNGLNNTLFSFSNVVLQSSVNSFGAAVIAGNSAADSLLSYVLIIPIQFSSACSCAAAQCYGARNYKRIGLIVKKGIGGCMLLVAGASTLVTILSPQLMRLFTDDPVVIASGFPKLMFTCWGYLIYSFSKVYSAALQGMHKTASMMVMNVVGICLPRVLWVWFIFPLFATPNMLYLIYPVSWVVSSLMLGVAYHRTKRQLLSA